MSFVNKSKSKFTPKIKPRKALNRTPKPAVKSSQGPEEALPQVASSQASLIGLPLSSGLETTPSQEVAAAEAKSIQSLAQKVIKQPFSSKASVKSESGAEKLKITRNKQKDDKINGNNQNDILSSIKLMTALSRRSSVSSNTGMPDGTGTRTRRLSSISRMDRKPLGRLVSEPEISSNASTTTEAEVQSPVLPVITKTPQNIIKKRKLAASSNFLDVKGQLKKPSFGNSPKTSSVVSVKKSSAIPLAPVVSSKKSSAIPAPANIRKSSSPETEVESDSSKQQDVQVALSMLENIKFIPILSRNRRVKSSEPENDKPDTALSPEEEDLDTNVDTALILDVSTNKVRQISKEDYNKYKQYIGESFKISDLSQIPKGAVHLNEELFQNFELDEDNFTISELCAPQLPIGKVSTDFKLAKEGARKRRLANQKRRHMRIEARKRGVLFEDYLHSVENGEEPKGGTSVFDQPEEKPAVRNVQLNLVEGQISVNAESKFYDTRENLNDSRQRIVENENPYENPIHSRSFSKHQYSDRWSFEETVRFYRALTNWGTDFAIIAELFPNRNRRQVKTKFTLEEKKNLYLVEMALNKKLPPDFDSYVDEINRCRGASEAKKFKSLEDFNKELEQEKLNHELNMQSIREEQKNAKEEDLKDQERKERHRKEEEMAVLRGEKKWTRKEMIQNLRAKEEVIGEILPGKLPLSSVPE